MNTRTLLVSGAILVSAVTTIGWPDLRLGPVLAAYVFTPLTTMLIMVLAAYFTAQWLIALSNQQLDGSRQSWNSD